MADAIDAILALETTIRELRARLAAVEAERDTLLADTVSFLREHAELTLAGRVQDPFLDGYSEALTWAADSIAYRATSRGEGDQDATPKRRCGPFEEREGSRKCLKCNDVIFDFADEDDD